jgi:hypothetical protein
MTVNTTNATPTGSKTLTVTLAKGADCQNSGSISKQVTLQVNAAAPTDTTAPTTTASAVFHDGNWQLH